MAAVPLVVLRGCRAIQLAGDGVRHARQLLLLFLEVLCRGGSRVLLEPLHNLLDSIQNLEPKVSQQMNQLAQTIASKTYGLLVVLVDLPTETILIVDLILQAESVVLQAVPGLDLGLDRLVLLGELLGFSDHAVDFLL